MSVETLALTEALVGARRTRQPINPITETHPGITLEEAYSVSQSVCNYKISREGLKRIGRKIGLTSLAVQKQIGVSEPDFGYLTSEMKIETGGMISKLHGLIQAKAEGEVAFELARDLVPEIGQKQITEADVVQATSGVFACIEIIDSRIKDWKIKIQDTVADNASSAFFVLGSEKVSLNNLASGNDLKAMGMSLYRNGQIESTGSGYACLGNPISAVRWLAQKMFDLGDPLRAGEIILSGAYGPVVPFLPGDHIKVNMSKLGSVEVNYAK